MKSAPLPDEVKLSVQWETCVCVAMEILYLCFAYIKAVVFNILTRFILYLNPLWRRLSVCGF